MGLHRYAMKINNLKTKKTFFCETAIPQKSEKYENRKPEIYMKLFKVKIIFT